MLPRSDREKVWKMTIFPDQGKVREFHFQSGKFRKMGEKSQGILKKKFTKFGSQQDSVKYIFYKLQAVYIQKHSFSNIHGLGFRLKLQE